MSIDQNHQALLNSYEDLKQALQKVIDIEQQSRENSLAGTPAKKSSVGSPNKNVNSSESLKQGQKDEPIPHGKDLEILGHINKISSLLNESNNRVQELVLVNSELENKLHDHENKIQNLIQELETEENKNKLNQ